MSRPFRDSFLSVISLLRPAAVISALVLTVAGCGGSSDSSSDGDSPSKDSKTSAAAPSADAATGATITGKGYTYNAPEGWEKPKQDIPGTEAADTFAADLGDDDGFADNVNVLIQDPTPGKLDDGIEKTLVSQLEQAPNVKDVEARERTTVAGDTSVHIASTQDNAVKNLSEQYYVVHDGVLYVITTSFSTTVSQADRDEISESIIASWKWAA